MTIVSNTITINHYKKFAVLEDFYIIKDEQTIYDVYKSKKRDEDES